MNSSKKDRFSKFNDGGRESFRIWRLRMEAVLKCKDCLGIITGDEIRPDFNLNDKANADSITDFDERSRKEKSCLFQL